MSFGLGTFWTPGWAETCAMTGSAGKPDPGGGSASDEAELAMRPKLPKPRGNRQTLCASACMPQKLHTKDIYS